VEGGDGTGRVVAEQGGESCGGLQGWGVSQGATDAGEALPGGLGIAAGQFDECVEELGFGLAMDIRREGVECCGGAGVIPLLETSQREVEAGLRVIGGELTGFFEATGCRVRIVRGEAAESEVIEAPGPGVGDAAFGGFLCRGDSVILAEDVGGGGLDAGEGLGERLELLLEVMDGGVEVVFGVLFEPFQA